MAGKVALSILLALSVLGAPVGVSARPVCSVEKTACPKPCDSPCCAKMKCCAESQHKTAPITPPLTKASDNSELFMAMAAKSGIAVGDVIFPSVRLPVYRADSSAHACPVLALSCALLI